METVESSKSRESRMSSSSSSRTRRNIQAEWAKKRQKDEKIWGQAGTGDQYQTHFVFVPFHSYSLHRLPLNWLGTEQTCTQGILSEGPLRATCRFPQQCMKLRQGPSLDDWIWESLTPRRPTLHHRVTQPWAQDRLKLCQKEQYNWNFFDNHDRHFR